MPSGELDGSLRVLAESGAAGQLLRRDGRMARLCTSQGTVRMDWADVAGELPEGGYLAGIERLATGWRRRGVRHVIWSAMGGAGVPASVLVGLGLTADGTAGVTVHALDSTDPSAADRVLRVLARGKGLPSDPGKLSPAHVRTLLADVVLVAVSLGLTTEEPASHLAWFAGLLDAAGLPPGQHALALTIPGSRLEEAARAFGAECHPACPGGGHGYPGRMSAPGTATFLLPLALSGASPRLVLSGARAAHDLAAIAADPGHSPYLRLAGALGDRSHRGCCRLMLRLPAGEKPLYPWVEMLLEQTTGKDGRGVVVFGRQPLNPGAAGFTGDGLASLTAGRGDGPPTLRPGGSHVARCAALASAMLGWQLTAAMLGWLNCTNIVNEPAVEAYKARSRALRGDPGLLAEKLDSAVAAAPQNVDNAADTLAARARDRRLSYLDVTVSGEMPAAAWQQARALLGYLGNGLLGVPVKLRTAPAAYHISEQAQMDGPPGVASVRIAALDRSPARLGDYTPHFLWAQSVAAAEAMQAAGRDCWLVAIPRLSGVADVITQLTGAVAARLGRGAPS
jgi:hypothetical protein